MPFSENEKNEYYAEGKGEMRLIFEALMTIESSGRKTIEVENAVSCFTGPWRCVSTQVLLAQPLVQQPYRR